MSSPPARSALAEKFLSLLPETLSPEERADRAIGHPSFPGGVNYNVLVFLSQNTLVRNWDRKNKAQTARLQQMVTKAICGGYGNWNVFQAELFCYLQDFDFTTLTTPPNTSGPRRSTAPSQRSESRTPLASV